MVNLATIASLTGWWEAPYSGSPLVGIAGVGTSGSNNLSEATNPPSIGSTLNGKAVINFDGVNDQLGGLNFGTLFSSSGYTFAMLVFVNSFGGSAAGTLAYTNAGLFGDSTGNFTVATSSINGGELQIYQYIGGDHIITIPITTGGWKLIWGTFNGTTMRAAVNGIYGTPVNVSSLGGTANPLRVGCNYNQTAFFNGNMAAFITSNVANAFTYDDIALYLNNKFTLLLSVATILPLKAQVNNLSLNSTYLYTYDKLLAEEQDKTKQKLTLLEYVLKYGELPREKRRKTGAPSQFNITQYAALFNPGSVSNMFVRWRASDSVVSSGVASIPNIGTLGPGGSNVNDFAFTTLKPAFVSADSKFNNKPSVWHNNNSGLKTGTLSSALTQANTFYAYTYISDTNDVNNVFIRGSNVGGSANSAGLWITPNNDLLKWGELGSLSATTTAIYGKHLTCLICNGASTVLYIDDMVTPFGSGTAGSGTCNSVLTGFSFGVTTADYTWTEQIGYTGSHDTATRAAIASYFTGMYG